MTHDVAVERIDHEVSQPMSVRFGSFDEGRDDIAVADLDSATGCVRQQRFDQVLNEHVASGARKQIAILGKVRVGLAGGHDAAGINLGRVFSTAIASTPVANRAEVFQAKSHRIDAAVTNVAGGILAVQGEFFTNGFCPIDVGVNGRHFVRRRRRVQAKQFLQDPNTACYRRGFDALALAVSTAAIPSTPPLGVS